MKHLVLWIGLLLSTTLFAEKNVLVLHSYHHGLPWTDGISKGIINTFEKSKEKVNIYFEYLDSKRQPNVSFLNTTFEYFLLKHQYTYFDAIIVADNDALVFMNQYQNQLFPNIPVIFCGINNFTPALISKLSQVTGIKEVANYQETLLVAQTLFPQKDKVMVVLDDTITGMSILEEVKKIEHKFKDKLQFYYFLDFSDEALEVFKEENKERILLYLLTYNRDKKGNFLSYDDGVLVMKKLFGAKTPIFGSWDFFLDKGIVGGVLTTGYTQGTMAAELALKVLHGERANNLSIQSNMGRDSIVLDYKLLEQLGIVELSKMIHNVKYINKPEGFLEKNKVFLLIFVIFVCLLCIIILLRELYKREKQRMQQAFDASLNHRIELALLQEEAQTDHLTGLLNRVTFEMRLSEALQNTAKEKKNFCLMMIDIDHFKKINDTYGHLVGDYILQEFAGYLKSYFRKGDFIFRYGGEEFIVFLSDISPEDAVASAEKLRMLVREKSFSVDEKVLYITLSIGLAMREGDETTNGILSRADQALYNAKSTGRDRVVKG